MALAPAGDLVEMHEKNGCGGIMPALMGGSPASTPDRYRAASPGELLPIGVPQAIVVAHHDERFLEFGRSYAAKAKNAGDERLIVVDAPQSGHFDVIAPTTTTWAIVRRTLDDLFAKLL